MLFHLSVLPPSPCIVSIATVHCFRLTPHSRSLCLHEQTTIIACACNGGVVLGADSRTSMGPLPPSPNHSFLPQKTTCYLSLRHHSGDFVANRVSDKIVPLCDNVFMQRSGSVCTSSDFLRSTTIIAPWVPLHITMHCRRRTRRLCTGTCARWWTS